MGMMIQIKVMTNERLACLASKMTKHYKTATSDQSDKCGSFMTVMLTQEHGVEKRLGGYFYSTKMHQVALGIV